MQVRVFFFINWVVVCASVISFAQAPKPAEGGTGVGSTTTANMYGEFTLTTNYVYQGISQTNGSFGMQPEAGYVFPRAKIGLWGSNVQFPSNTESLNLKPFGWYDIIFGSNIDMKIRFDISMYFRSNDKNTNIFKLDFNYIGHHFILENSSNWFGTGQGSYWLGYTKTQKAFWDVDLKVDLGMQYMSSSRYSTYIAGRAALGYKYIDLNYELAFNYNMNSSQFANGIADPSATLSVTALF